MDVANSEREVSREKDADHTRHQHEDHAVAVMQFQLRRSKMMLDHAVDLNHHAEEQRDDAEKEQHGWQPLETALTDERG